MRKHPRGRALVGSVLVLAVLGLWFLIVTSIGDDAIGRAWQGVEDKTGIPHLARRPWFVGATAGLLALVVLGSDVRRHRLGSDQPACTVTDLTEGITGP